MELTVAVENADNILKEIGDAFYDIPFENSFFQTGRFVLAAQLTPGRAYRALGLRMSSKLQAISELKFSRKLAEVDVDEYHQTIKDTDSIFERRRAVIELEKLEAGNTYTNKLLNDAIKELNFMYSEFKKFPTYTREQFEAEELEHFNKKLRRQIDTKGNGSIESLSYMQDYDTYTALVEETKKERLKIEN